MRSYTTTLLFIVALVMAAYIYFFDRHRDSVAVRREIARMAFHFDPSEAVGLHIETPGARYALSATNGDWRIVQPVSGPADNNAVLRILDNLADLRWVQMISPGDTSASDVNEGHLGFNPPRVSLAIQFGSDSMEVQVGRDTPSGHQMYLKRSGLQDIFVVNRDLLKALPASLLDLRDRRLVSIPPARIRHIEWKSSDRGEFSASRDENEQWAIESPVHARGSGSEIRQWLDELYDLSMLEFIAESVAAGSLYGFDQPLVELSLFGGAASTPCVLRVGRAVDYTQSEYYASLAGQDAVFSISGTSLALLSPDLDRLRDHRLMTIQPNEISHIEMIDHDRNLVLARNTHRVWEVVAPKRFLASGIFVHQLLDKWTGATVNRFIDKEDVDMSAAGLDTTNRIIALSRRTIERAETLAASGKPDFAVTIGTPIDGGFFYARNMADGELLRLPGELLESFVVDPMLWRDPVVLALNSTNIHRIIQVLGDSRWEVEKSNNTFRATMPQTVPVGDAIDSLLGVAERVVAARFIAEDVMDLASYGLDKPHAQIILGMVSAGINRVLLIGGALPGGQHYATIQGSDVVFIISEDNANRFLRPICKQNVSAAESGLVEDP